MSETKTIEQGSKVRMHFALAVAGGPEAVSTFDDEPVEVIVGSGDLDPGLEAALLGLSEQHKVTLHLSPGIAYGENDPERIQRIALADFPKDLEPKIDLIASFATPSGEQTLGRILEISGDDATVDFNHPLAGQPLEFTVEILNIENAAQ